jgi:enamine deaminase RidA (YjgF/YER057c/UK114 family)
MPSRERRRLTDIERHLVMDGADAKPIISRVVAHRDRVYVCGITGDPVGDVTTQTRQVWLTGMRLFRTHDLAWNEWVDPGHPPVRACVQAEPFAPGLLVYAAALDEALRDDDPAGRYREACRWLDEGVRGTADRGEDSSTVYAGLYGVLQTPEEVVGLVLAIEGELLAGVR